ncbi:hypothetical protein CAPTEDRAFT_194059 [Capitella teleta]|uniref:BZIP domain-containing protein n=1 Tax=Capitella teleta TaxID=283909 RepID=R7VIM4_CAPTE|nr:hypothetical protein CAPTEDRAFT_194059 [Capitella teleta]|eukprot:ELU18479.1 hypothetical protein CAPTEDRAFT_194059 [Capitella teleta]
MALFRVSSLVPPSLEPGSAAAKVSLRLLRSHEKYETSPAPEPLPNPRSPLTPASPELPPPSQSRRRHRMAACRDCHEAQEEKVALKEKNRHLQDTLAKYREEVLQMKAQILALQQTNSELRERNVILQDEALEALIPDLLSTAPQPPSTQHPVHRRQPRPTACAPAQETWTPEAAATAEKRADEEEPASVGSWQPPPTLRNIFLRSWGWGA